MSSAQQRAFKEALVTDFKSVEKVFTMIDVRACECSSASDTTWLLGELERDVGLTKCNTEVIALLSDALIELGQAALTHMQTAERGTSDLIVRLATLLKQRGKLVEAEDLYAALGLPSPATYGADEEDVFDEAQLHAAFARAPTRGSHTRD